MKKMSAFSSCVPKLLTSLRCEEKVNNVRVLLAWNEIAGPVTREHATAVRVQGDTLLVRTDSPVWSHTLSLMQEQFLDKLQHTVPQKKIRQIRFITGAGEDGARRERMGFRKRRNSHR